MKTLALLRHGKSSWDDPALADIDRPLTKRGRNASTLIGEEMRRLGLAFDLVLASPAVRVAETLRWVERGYGQTLNATILASLYAAQAADLIEQLKTLDDAVGRCLLIGHNPGLQLLASDLANRDDPLRPAVDGHFPTAALALLRLPFERWAELESNRASLEAFILPRALRA